MSKKVIGFFSGVGGIELGFQRVGCEVIWSNEFDSKAQETFKANFDSELNTEDVRNLEETDIPMADIVVGGFPCQSFSHTGRMKGFEDERGNLFFEIIRLIKKQKPRVLFFENVKHLENHDGGNTFKVIKGALEELGYQVKHKVINTLDHNIPQNRERIFIVAFREKVDYDYFSFPMSEELTTTIHSFADFKGEVPAKYYYTEQRHKFYPKMKETMTKSTTTYQWRRDYTRENKSGVCPTLTANMGTGGNNVPIILTNHGIRKLTPRECFNFQGFPQDFVLPEIADSHLYKQSGNTVTVPVVEKIANQILQALFLGDLAGIQNYEGGLTHDNTSDKTCGRTWEVETGIKQEGSSKTSSISL